MPGRVGGGPRTLPSKDALMEWLRSILGATEETALAGPPGAAGIGAGALGQVYSGAADVVSGVGKEIGQRFTGAAGRFQEGAGFGGIEAPKPPTLAGPTERAVIPGPRVSQVPPKKVVDPLDQPVAGPGFQQGVPPTPQPSFNLGRPGDFQGLGAANLDMPTIQQPGVGARSLQGLKEIFGPGGAVDWEFNIPDTGITFAPGQTGRQRAGALAGREAEAGIAATQAGALKDISQAGVYELEADPDFQRLKLLSPQLAAALLEQGRNERFGAGLEATEQNIYTKERGLDARAQFGAEARRGDIGAQATYAGINKGLPSGGDLLRDALQLRQQYDKIALEQGPEAAEQFRASLVAARPELAAYLPAPPQQESGSWWPWGK